MTDGVVRHAERMDTVHEEGVEDCRLRILSLLNGFPESCRIFGGGILVSVVPEQTAVVSDAVKQVTGMTLKVLETQEACAELDVCVDYPERVGLDRLADAVGAKAKYGCPLIIVDMGTATTVNVVDARGRFVGGMIIPGMRTSFDALCEKASQLSPIPLVLPENLIGKNTTECMQSGLLYGYASMIDGLVERVEKELGTCCRVVMTGGLARLIYPVCKHPLAYEEHLLLEGLYHIATRRK